MRSEWRVNCHLRADRSEERMNSRLTAILLLALVISGGATFLVYRVTRRAAQNPGTPTSQVVMAARPLELGTLVKDADLTIGPWSGSVPAGMITKKETVVGRGVVAPIYQGEPVFE